MAPANAYFSNFLRLRFRGAVCILFFLTINSCQQNRSESTGYSEAFKPVFKKVTLLFGSNRLEEGLHLIDSSLSRMDKPNIDDRFRKYGFHYIYWHNAKHDDKHALIYADSMLSLAKKSLTKQQYIANYAEANFAFGDAYFSLEKYNEAYQHYFQGYITGKNNLNNDALSDYTYRMGMIMYKMKNYHLAAGYFKQSYSLNALKDDAFAFFYRQQEVLDNIGLSYKHNDQPDSAITYFNKALQLIEQNEPKFKNRLKMMEMAKGVIYGNKAEIFTLTGDYTKAIDLLKKSISINLQKGYDNNDAELAEIKLAQLYADHKKIDSLYSLLSVMRLQLDSVKNDNAEADWNRLMSKYYVHQNQLSKALGHLQSYNNLKDSINRRLNILRESDINKQVDTYEKQYQIDNLTYNNKLQQIFLYVAIFCAFMALIIVFLVYRNWRRSKRDVRIVNELNKMISRQKTNLEQTLAELEISGFEKDRILRTVAHDLRNPIGGIASLTMVMEEEDYTEEQKGMISLIKETSNNSLELINEILEVTNNGSTVLKKEPVEINSLTSKSVELLRFRAAEKRQVIMLEALASPEELMVSREKIWRVLGNLISNAIKFSPAGGVIEVKMTDNSDDVEISVKDAGIGIPENVKDKIFNMFTEAKRPGTAGEKSFGLGLSISKQIVEAHNGKIWFKSNKDKGSTFYIRLPKILPGVSLTSKNLRTKGQMI